MACERQGFHVSVAITDHAGLVRVLMRDDQAGPHELDTSVKNSLHGGESRAVDRSAYADPRDAPAGHESPQHERANPHYAGRCAHPGGHRDDRGDRGRRNARGRDGRSLSPRRARHDPGPPEVIRATSASNRSMGEPLQARSVRGTHRYAAETAHRFISGMAAADCGGLGFRSRSEHSSGGPLRHSN